MKKYISFEGTGASEGNILMKKEAIALMKKTGLRSVWETTEDLRKWHGESRRNIPGRNVYLEDLI